MTKIYDDEEDLVNTEETIDIEEELAQDIEDIEKSEEKIEISLNWITKIQDELIILKDSLARSQADYQNLLRRVERDKWELWIYLTSNIITKFLPQIDNLERIINVTPDDLKNNSLFEWVKSVYSWLTKILENMNVVHFESIGKEVDPNLHDVMTQAPWEEWIIIQEFEKGYQIWDKIIRHAKVVVGNWE